jgi:hypothetical protein
MKKSQQQQREGLRRNEEKWTKPLMAAGWTVIPSVILERQQALGLDPLDVNILLQLARYWWVSDNPPRPSKSAIAACVGVDVSTVRRRIARLERDGLITRQARFRGGDGGQDANAYHFDGLIREALPYAEEAVQVREQRKQEDVARRTRKRPNLRVIRAPESAENR